MLVGLGESMTVETARRLLPRVMRAMRIADMRNSLHQQYVTRDSIGFADDPHGLRARILMSVSHSTGDEGSLILHAGDPVALAISARAIRPPCRADSVSEHPGQKHPIFEGMLEHGIGITRWARDALLTVIAGDALAADELVGVANAAAAMARTAERYTQNGASNTCMATPMSKAGVSPFLHTEGLQDGHHPFVVQHVPMSFIGTIDDRLVLSPVYGEHHPSDDPLHRMRVHAHEAAVMAHATRMGLLP